MPKLKQKNSYLNHLLRNQLTSLILYEKIETGLSKAKKIKPLAEKLLMKASRGDLNARRYAAKILFDKKAVKKLFDLLAPKVKNKKSAPIKIYQLGRRVGDNAPQALIMLGKDLQTVVKTDKKKVKTKAVTKTKKQSPNE